MGRKKRIGRLPKNFERKCQAASKKGVGHPSKYNKQLSNATNTSVVDDDFVKMKSMKLPSLWNMSHCNDHHVIYKVQEQSSSTQPVVISPLNLICHGLFPSMVAQLQVNAQLWLDYLT